MTTPTAEPRALPERQLAAFAAGTAFDAIPPATVHEAKRSLVNILATTLAGCREPAVEIAVAAMAPLSPGGPCTLVGRGQTADPALAAFVNAMAANIFDFDDTHEATVIHPAAIVFAACLAQAQAAPCDGRRFLRAFVIGCEVECRIGNAVSPGHYARGWHITSTCGTFGAAAGVGVLLGLDADRILHALSAAAVQTGGLVQTLGTMAKSVSVGAAARAGLLAARLAAAGLTGPASPLSGPLGWLAVHSDDPRPGALTDGLGQRWELSLNTYKPYPVGVVLNPVIDAALELRRTHGLQLGDVARIELTGHPLLRQRTDRADVATGRESQVSAQHALTIVLMRGRAGLHEFTDAAVAETLAGGRPPVTFHDQPGRDIASVEMVLHLRTGELLHASVTAARGSRTNPLTDADLEEKLATLAARTGAGDRAAPLAAAIWRLEAAGDAGATLGSLAR